MKKQLISNLAAILRAIATLFLCLVLGTAYNARGTAAAAPLEMNELDPTASQAWLDECVDCPRHFVNMTDRSLRLDASGRPRIAYGSDHLYYAWNDGATWHQETVDNAPRVGSYATLVLDGGHKSPLT